MIKDKRFDDREIWQYVTKSNKYATDPVLYFKDIMNFLKEKNVPFKMVFMGTHHFVVRKRLLSELVELGGIEDDAHEKERFEGFLAADMEIKYLIEHGKEVDVSAFQSEIN